ncbi:MAG: hypothetical protein OMM_11075, partial [Candidatus Magnetoglobus multicellularis str. Araruama]
YQINEDRVPGIGELIFRAFRGNGKISVYQWMSLISCVYVMTLPYIFKNTLYPIPDIVFGFKAMWQPQIIFFAGHLDHIFLVYWTKPGDDIKNFIRIIKWLGHTILISSRSHQNPIPALGPCGFGNLEL